MSATKLRGLVLDAEAKAKADKIRAHAEANHYMPTPDATTPGDDPHFVGYFNSYRVVFTVTDQDGKLWRHLSCSVPGDKFPNPIAVFSLCDLFGFTGYDGRSMHLPRGWSAAVGPGPVKHVIVVQRYEKPN